MTSGNNIETEYLELNSKNEWPALYQRIRAQSIKDSRSCTEAVKPQNKVLNRYRDVSPYDHSRIVLQRGSTDYINANLIKIEKANRQYILTQGPLFNTCSHFWLMVWEQETMAVVMLNKLIEKKQDKCYQYWPSKIGPDYIMEMQDVGLTVEYIEQCDYSYYLTRVLRLTDIESGVKRDILQFHYTTWPDFGVPQSPAAFLDFLRRVRDAGALEASVGPAVVHCSAGIGRSGTFCLVDSALVLIEKFGLNSVDVKEILLEMRKYRMGLIQTPEQLRFSYQAIIEGAKQILNQSSDNEEDNHLEGNNSIKTDISSSVTTTTTTTTNQSEDDDDNDDSEEEEDEGPPPPPPPRLDSLRKQNGVISAVAVSAAAASNNADAVAAVGGGVDRPLPNIPKSVSDHELIYADEDEREKSYITTPLPIVPAGEEDEEEDEPEEDEEDDDDDGSENEEHDNDLRSESPISDNSDITNTTNKSSSYELRQRNRVLRKQTITAQVRDMKRRQQINEQWTQLKRSLYIPFLAGGALLIGGGLFAYIYYRN